MTFRKLHLTDPTLGADTNEADYTVTVDYTSGPEALRLTVSHGSLHIYQGTTKVGRVDLPEPDESIIDAAFARALAALPDKVELVELDRSYELSDKQIQDAFRDENPWDDGDLDDLESDGRFEGAMYYIETYVDNDDLELLRETEDKVDELRWAVEERDTSDVFGQLASNTGSRPVRYRIDYDVESGWNATDDEIAADVAGIAEALGIDAGTHGEFIRSIMAEASSGGGLWLFWNGDIEELILACQGGHPGGTPDPQTITLTNPELMILGSFDGSGYSEQIEATITLPFDRERLFLDAPGIGPGYSWTEITGGVTGTDATVTFTAVQPVQS